MFLKVESKPQPATLAGTSGEAIFIANSDDENELRQKVENCELAVLANIVDKEDRTC